VTKVAETPSTRIRSEDDLYSGDVVVDDDLGVLDENKNRHIKPDNIVAISGSQFKANEIESKGGSVGTAMFGLSWAYQFTDNYFIEGVYGRALLDSYPAEGAQTLVNQVVARLKYNIKGPAYTFIMPYLGYQSNTVSSPDAGKGTDPNLNEEELDAIDMIFQEEWKDEPKESAKASMLKMDALFFNVAGLLSGLRDELYMTEYAMSTFTSFEPGKLGDAGPPMDEVAVSVAGVPAVVVQQVVTTAAVQQIHVGAAHERIDTAAADELVSPHAAFY
jgi:hypothetical protein